jgi:uncharacterized membrane protein HdeD (DUF308 family)
MSLTDGADLVTVLNRSLHQHWRTYLIEGIILLLLGLAAIVVPLIAGLGITIILGWLFLTGGLVGLIATFGARQAPGFWWSLLSALVALVAGLSLLWNPLMGLVTLTYVLIAYFVVDGVLSIVHAIEHRREASSRWEWMIFSGVIDLALAALIISGLPGAFAWALGLMVGIDLIFAGWSLVTMALAARDAVP